MEHSSAVCVCVSVASCISKSGGPIFREKKWIPGLPWSRLSSDSNSDSDIDLIINFQKGAFEIFYLVSLPVSRWTAPC